MTQEQKEKLRLRKQRIGKRFSKLELIEKIIEIDDLAERFMLSDGCGCCADEPEHSTSGDLLTRVLTDLQ